MLEINKKLDFENNCWVGLVNSSNFNSSEEDRIKAVTDIASITKGRLGMKSPFEEVGEIRLWEKRQNLYNRLLKESAGKPSTPFEFIPVITREDDKDWSIDFFNNWMKHVGYYEPKSGGVVLTNLRNDPYSVIDVSSEEFKDYSGFKVIVGQVPKQVYDHIVMHRSFSRISESSRNKRYLKEVEFWIDSKQSLELQEMEKYDNEQSIKRAFEYIEKGMKPEQATKRLPCTRLIKFALGAWLQDENSWKNLFAVRGNNTGTMSITRITVNNIKRLING